ncbi:hypothetical protein SCHPADRAFT_946892 [Schizopora paradoxa]|uniref:Uncharacterized protein n=1 Tax=Schizopora paradoxa TaxID=27342 RepID=A0A0H2R196_9AGAM|nr:hypothetical protein SCHPADRAFT_946892 [Schizopora paradoxa]
MSFPDIAKLVFSRTNHLISLWHKILRYIAQRLQRGTLTFRQVLPLRPPVGLSLFASQSRLHSPTTLRNMKNFWRNRLSILSMAQQLKVFDSVRITSPKFSMNPYLLSQVSSRAQEDILTLPSIQLSFLPGDVGVLPSNGIAEEYLDSMFGISLSSRCLTMRFPPFLHLDRGRRNVASPIDLLAKSTTFSFLIAIVAGAILTFSGAG